jgi:hypothetical protein
MRHLVMILALAAASASAETFRDLKEKGKSKTPPTLINGQPADPAKWPASVYARLGNSRCSATVVGERVLLIAAHCVKNGGSASFSARGASYTATCKHHPDYKSDKTADWSLCLINKKVTGVPYERLVSSTNWCSRGKEVLLTGYGCTKEGGTGGNDGVYRIGKANITRCPGSNHDTVTKGGGALCYGDSGGPAFLLHADGSREVFGVNSRGNIADTSYLSTVSTTKAKSWMNSWAANNGQRICGLHADAQGCRSGSTPTCEKEKAAVDSAAKALDLAEKALQVCQATSY